MNIKKEQNILYPSGEKRCIWMDAGVINYKLCHLNYNCDHCSLHKALLEAYGTEPSQQHSPVQETNQVKETMIQKMFSQLPASARKCRYMLNGHVSHRLCINQFQCHSCKFNQQIEDTGEEIASAPPWDVCQVDRYLLPAGLHFHRSHSWLLVMQRGMVKVGIDDFGQNLLGNILSIRNGGDERTILQGDAVGYSLQTHYGTVYIMLPVSGTLVKVNKHVLKNTELVNNDPYGKGWLFVIKPLQLEKDLKNLFYGPLARNWLEDEVRRFNALDTQNKVTGSKTLKEFLMSPA